MDTNSENAEKLNKRVEDLLQGEGSQVARNLTVQTFLSFPSLKNLLRPELLEGLEKHISLEVKKRLS